MDEWGRASTLNRELEVRDQIEPLMWRWRSGSVLRVSASGRVAVATDRKSLAWQETWGELPDDAIYLGSCDQGDLFALINQKLNGSAATLREILPHLDDTMKEAACMAVCLAHWHSATNLCGVCGGKTHVTQAGVQRLCPSCQRERYPRTDPAIIVAIIDDEDRLMLARNSSWESTRRSLIAGFVEAGESLEQCVRREVLEEVGVRVDRVQYLGSQPWPFPRSLMVGFVAHAQHPDVIVTSQEIAKVDWYSRAELDYAVETGEVVLPGGGSIASRIISEWRTGVLTV